MNPAMQSGRPVLAPATTAFVLSAAVTILFNTALALAKDAYPPLNGWMKSMTGHHWTTHGLADLVIFLGLGFLVMKTGAAGKINPSRLAGVLVAAVTIAAAGLFVWYVVT